MTPILKRFGVGRLLGLATLVGLLALRIADIGPLETLRLKTWDVFQQLSPRAQKPFTVRVVDIDEASLAVFGQWPWPRTILADLIARLSSAGAVVIGFDAVFAEPDRLSPGYVAASLPGLDEETRMRLRLLPSHDRIMADAMRRARVVLGQVPDTRATVDGSEADTGPWTSVAMRIARDIDPARADPLGWLQVYPRLIRNVPELESAAAGRGVFVAEPDRDGIIRRVGAVHGIGTRIAPSLATEMLRVATGTPTLLVNSDTSGIQSLVIANIEIPTDQNGHVWPRFSRLDKRRSVSAAEVLGGRVDAAEFRGKLVFVGASAASLFDLRATPLERNIPGVELNAQVLESMIEQSLLRRPGSMALWEMLGTVLVGLAIVALVPVLGAARVLALGAGAVALVTAITWSLFKQRGLLADLTFPALATFATFAVLTSHNYIREERQRGQIRSAFGRYVSPELIAQILSQPDRLKLGGETREVSVLFSDVRGFTGIAELYKGDPQGLTSLMNRLLTPLTNAILDQRGTIDKYMGDAVLAFWNAPLDDAEHPAHACLAALDMLERMRRLNDERRAESETSGMPYKPIAVGIGINTGVCTVGNMGSDLRFDYSVLGDSVNVAARLESLTKAYGVGTLIGSETARRASRHVTTLAVDIVRVKGKAEPEEMHTILGPPALADDPGFQALASAFAGMRFAYGAQDWTDAGAALAACRAADTEQRLPGVLDLYADRIALCTAGSVLPADWDGVWTLAGKDG